MDIENEDATARLGAMLAGLTRAGDAILLSGPLGAGKSVLARAYLRSLCHAPDMEVPSPTYTLVQPYTVPARACGTDVGAVHHFDLWRLGGPEEVEELGWDDAREGVVLVEWPERLEDLTPPEALFVTLTPLADGKPPGLRRAALRGWADRLTPSVFAAAGLVPAQAPPGGTVAGGMGEQAGLRTSPGPESDT
ncbi:tRNA (adenosine(37)-N6)-threonylcarbamoyltransferase complex ATPase subunit type 1 TsaE [Acetobacter sp. TBRC 12305]|uniref:tRNA threonylcarbamoyladenosine biosynthesis protein TsaE n=1 Tax=Acetobacter garciniae TaxID=2817435 RepID=A0A939HMZ6_9PROT|nr:tRNA (adenosine(37)-N6)-threonylcarbamoyltransferase complex ATPase subunit type 1 TsaE [Acetobacter garciniae]MBX0344056.1 tRNA (adenosine(37)-N6)-threonylcarbamoyltransferase complex ATPase subunit type 1 TsaE [Acetobacter garciniae]